jgi:uncharacterized protein GlcG (DUF336 family)
MRGPILSQTQNGKRIMSKLTLAQASTIIDQALATGRERKFHPLTVAVLDPGGTLTALKREDDSSLLRPEIATGKAWGALGMGFGGRELARRAAAQPQFIGALVDASGGRMVPGIGGVLIRTADGELIGAVGISGDTAENDEICAVAGVEAAGLIADTGAPKTA